MGKSRYDRSRVPKIRQWVGQFIGHAIEGRKPAFVDDLRSFLVAPAWLLGDLYRRLGLSF
jgi:uncharacterized membrane protein YGL010W